MHDSQQNEISTSSWSTVKTEPHKQSHGTALHTEYCQYLIQTSIFCRASTVWPLTAAPLISRISSPTCRVPTQRSVEIRFTYWEQLAKFYSSHFIITNVLYRDNRPCTTLCQRQSTTSVITSAFHVMFIFSLQTADTPLVSIYFYIPVSEKTSHRLYHARLATLLTQTISTKYRFNLEHSCSRRYHANKLAWIKHIQL